LHQQIISATESRHYYDRACVHPITHLLAEQQWFHSRQINMRAKKMPQSIHEGKFHCANSHTAHSAQPLLLAAALNDQSEPEC
jgi:hypothetical protein